ncbi:MAG TPA: alpha-L-arabinofuranosidase C-terminal domain-containing protein, partial [Phycisphaerae bacterium]
MKTLLAAATFSFLLTQPLSAADLSITIHSDKATKTIDRHIYGQFLEHIFNSVHGGLWGDQILNGTLEGRNPGPPAAATLGNPPRYWEFFGDPAAGEVQNDAANPFNADSSVRIHRVAVAGGRPGDSAAGIRQKNISLTKGEKYTLSMYVRGAAGTKFTVDFSDATAPLMSQEIPISKDEWSAITMDFTPSRSADAAALQITMAAPGDMHVDQISLFSASALATGGYRPDLLKAVADLQPATIRWPGGSFANKYIWQNGIGPREKRLPHPVEQWNDRDTYQFGTDEFLRLCEKIGAEPILVINTARGVDDALHWLEYCMGDVSTPFGKQRAANGHPAPYPLKTIEIDNETWLLMEFPKYVDIVNQFCPAIRAKFPTLKLSVCGSYAYDTGPGEGVAANANWDQRLLDQAAQQFDVLSPHYYNGLLAQHPPDFKEDPRKYEEFLKSRGDMIKKSANPNIKIYVSEWNLTYRQWGNDWRVGLYAAGILNAFERQGDLVTMSCPALFMRKIGVTQSWDNALINFNESSWFPAANYVVMKLWRESYAPNLLATDAPDHLLNFLAARTADKKTIYLKMVNPETEPVSTKVTLDGDLTPNHADLQMIDPGSPSAKNSIANPNTIQVTPALSTL